MNEQFHTQQVIDHIISVLENSPWKDTYVSKFQRFRDEADMPCVLAVAGKVKAGKSSFLNALLGVDLAMVGTTETTATINYFRYPRPDEEINPEKPVVVHWNDGRPPEAQTLDFLNSLQGHTTEVLDKAEKIHHLEYVLKHETLRYITLVDTPGFGSVEDRHEQRTESFFNPERAANLRKNQEEVSNELTEGADAVLYVSMRVPDMGAQRFFGEYVPNITPLNALGVMTKIDNEYNATSDVINNMCHDLANSFRRLLSTVVPVSAGIYHTVRKLQKNGNERLKWLQENLRKVPQADFERKFNASTFLKTEGAYDKLFSKYGLSYEIRKEMVGDLPWMVFFTIAKALYAKELNDAVDYLLDYSGMDKVKAILEQQFFSRARSIRCSRIIKEAQKLLLEIKNIQLQRQYTHVENIPYYKKLIDYAKTAYQGGSTIRLFPDQSLTYLKDMIEQNTISRSECDRLSGEIDCCLSELAKVLEAMSSQTNSSEALRLLESNSHLLRGEDEIKELERLFGKYSDVSISGDTSTYARGQRKWNARIQQVQNNPEYRQLAQFAYEAYTKLLSETKIN